MKNILIIDDSVSIRKEIRKILKSVGGIKVVGEAAEPVEALKLYEAHKPDIIILDIDLKDGNGIDVLAQIRSSEKKVIIIMFTNYFNAAFQKASERLGANYFLDKTNDVDKLINIMKELAHR
ncbi:MAG: response regulator transcription factor [Ignavibacteria bacterium]|nr:response regulator transcription factor [Ignavibacteria bacterium]